MSFIIKSILKLIGRKEYKEYIEEREDVRKGCEQPVEKRESEDRKRIVETYKQCEKDNDYKRVDTLEEIIEASPDDVREWVIKRYEQFLKERKFKYIKDDIQYAGIPFPVDEPRLREIVVRTYLHCLHGHATKCVEELNEITGRKPIDFEEVGIYAEEMAEKFWKEGLYSLLQKHLKVTGVEMKFNPDEVNERYRNYLKRFVEGGEFSHWVNRIIDLYELTQIRPDTSGLEDLIMKAFGRLIRSFAFDHVFYKFMDIFGRPDFNQLKDDMKEACRTGIELGLYHHLERLERITGLKCRKILWNEP